MRRITAGIAKTVMMMMLFAMAGATVGAQAYRPMVAMSLALPDGKTQKVSVPEGGLTTVMVGAHEYGFRPTMMDDVGQRIVIAEFDMGARQTR
jgi:hypothetical protein